MIPRFQHILVPVDFTAKNEAALDVAFETAIHNHAHVTLLHVVQTIDYADEEIDDYYARLESAACKNLDRMAQRFAEAGVAVDFKTRLGSRTHEIVQYANQHNIDLIVMSSHRIDREQPVKSLGTISYQVSMLCQCPVILVK
jgi:universal stress protein A